MIRTCLGINLENWQKTKFMQKRVKIEFTISNIISNEVALIGMILTRIHLLFAAKTSEPIESCLRAANMCIGAYMTNMWYKLQLYIPISKKLL